MAIPPLPPLEPPERESVLRAPRARRKREWAQRAARAACIVLAAIGLLPVLAGLIVRSAWARAWAAGEAERLLSNQGILAAFRPSVHVWPLGLELQDVRVESSDGRRPLLECPSVTIRPRLFALLAEKLVIAEISLDSPRIRAVIQDGRLANLSLKSRGGSKGPPGPFHAPFGTFSVTDASLDLAVNDVRVESRGLDVDATAEDDPTLGSSFEIAVRAGRTAVHEHRRRHDSTAVVDDDDALCSLEARARYEPGSLLVRRFEGVGAADLDDDDDAERSREAGAKACDVLPTDKRRVELSLGHVHIGLPSGPDARPRVDGHVRARAPIQLAERAVHLPETDGWVAVDADVHYGEESVLPDVSGTFEAHDVRLDQYGFAQEVRSQVTIQRGVVESPRTTIRLAGGTITLSDARVDPLARGARIEHVRMDASNVDFTTLMRDLGVHKSSWVGWDVREIHAPAISGTLSPLKIDGDFTARTYSFGVYDRPAEDRARERIFGFSEAQLAAHFGVRADALRFSEIHATLPHSHLDGGMVSIGFRQDLRVEAPHVEADLEDLSPLGPVAMRGRIMASARVGGTFHHPEPEADIQSLAGFMISDVAFGDLTAGHVAVEVSKPEVQITGVHARRRESPYEVPTARLTFGGGRGFQVDAVASSPGFGFRDLLSMFALEDDPRYDGIDGTMAARADVHVALGGPEDACGGGYINVGTKARLRNVTLYGERFAQGDADLSLRWLDRQSGIAGADVDVRSFVLNKVQPPTGTRAGATGTVLGSASIRHGGALAANVMIEGVPLSRIDAFGRFQREVEGSLSGVAHVTGQLDDFRPDAGIVARAEIDVSSTRVRGTPLPGSHLDVRMTHRMPQQHAGLGRTGCGAPISAPFDKLAYSADASSHGEYTVQGDLFGGTIHLNDVVMTRARSPHVSGRASLRGVDLGAVARVLSPPAEGEYGAAAASDVEGQLWGELLADDIPLDAPSRSRARLLLGPTVVSRGGQKLTLQPPRDPIVIADDALKMPPLLVTLDTPEGFRGGFELSGGASKLTSDPTLALDARLEPVDLAVLRRLLPKVDRAAGTLNGSLRVTGKVSSPVLTGALHAACEDVLVHGLPGAVTDARVDVTAAGGEILASGLGKFAGGTVAFEGSVPLQGLEVGSVHSRVTLRGVRFAPADGVSATADADLDVAYDGGARRAAGASLPRLTGDVTLTSFDYTRPISLSADLSSLATRARRTNVETYDPSQDFMALDLHVHSREALVIKNNLVEAQLRVDAGGLEVTGTNQRMGLRGALRAAPGGRFRFQANDFDVQQAIIRFDDPTRIAPTVDITAVTEYRRYTDTSAGSAAGAGTTAGPSAASIGATRGGSLWRITLHAYGDADDLRVDLTSEPTLTPEDIVLLLAVGMTRAELDQLGASSVGESVALNYLGAASGADRAVKQVLPVIDDFRFGSAYSTATGKTEPQLTIGKRLTSAVRASVTTGLGDTREVKSGIELRLNNHVSVQGSYDNINDVSSSPLGNIGMDLRWRLDFE
jgi:translocation and assembly module TamB